MALLAVSLIRLSLSLLPLLIRLADNTQLPAEFP